MGAFTIFFLVIGFSAPSFGRLVDRYGARIVMAIGAFVTGLGFVFVSMMSNIWHFYGGYIFVGLGMAATGTVPTTTIVTNWFKSRRGTAIGIMSTGIGAGGFILAPIIGGYLIPNFGWRVSYVVMASLAWIIIPLALFVVRTKPADMGLSIDGVEVIQSLPEAESSSSVPKGLTLKMASATSCFWLIAISFLINGFSQVGIIQNQVPHLEDIGFSASTAATALGFVGLGSLIGKFGFGWLCDKIQPKYAWSISLGLQATGAIILMVVRSESSVALIWLYAIIMGLGAGGWLPTMSMLVSTNFGLASYGAIFGMIALAQSTGVATGPLVAGYMYDTTNTYYWAFIMFLVLYAFAMPAVFAIRRPKAIG